MINDDTYGMTEFCRRDVFGTRISALYVAYGDSFRGVSFRVQRLRGEIVAALCVCDGDAVICSAEAADFEELSEYLRFTGFRSLLCEKGVRINMRIPYEKTGYVVRTDSVYEALLPDRLTNRYSDFSYRSVYDILKACGFSIGDYSAWLADISLRCRRDSAKIIAVREGGRTVSTAGALYITDTAVLLGAVGTLPDMRGKGFAGKAVRSLASEFVSRGKRVELLCEEHRLSFYEQNEFYTVGEWSQ